VSNYVEIRVDSWKLSQLTRRPEPRGAEDIGTWFSVLSFISCVAVVTNSAISVYTATQTIDYTWSERSYLFIGITGIIFTAKAVLSYIIYLVYVTIWLDTDTVVDVQIARQAYIEKKVVLNFKDDADFNPGKAPLLPHYTIGRTDDDPL
jgi:anoctamin-10/anoctamin-7